jgi:hypothetical protein
MKFAKGRAKTGGRVKGTPNKGPKKRRPKIRIEAAPRRSKTTETAPNADAAIIDEIIAQALAGSVDHQRLFLRYLRVAERYLAPIEYVAPSNEVEARQTILVLGDRVARGEISIEAHETLLSGLRLFLGMAAAEKMGAGGERFVIVEGNDNADLPLSPDDASQRPALTVVPSIEPAPPAVVADAPEASSLENVLSFGRPPSGDAA